MIEEVVKAAMSVIGVTSIIDRRCFPVTFIQKDGGLPRWPAARYTIISAVNADTVCGTDDETTDDTRIQMDLVAETNQELKTLVTAVIAAFMGLEPPCSRDNYFKTYDEPTRTYRAVLDFTFYPSSEEAS